MQFRLGGELGRMVEKEAEVRGMSGPMLVKAIVGDWFMDTYKKRVKRPKKPLEQSLEATEGVPDEDKAAKKGKATAKEES